MGGTETVLPAMNSSAASVGQGTVNCPNATDPCGRVASHIALCVWYLTFLIHSISASIVEDAKNCQFSGITGKISLSDRLRGWLLLPKYHPRHAEMYVGFEVLPSESGITTCLIGDLGEPHYWDGSEWVEGDRENTPDEIREGLPPRLDVS